MEYIRVLCFVFVTAILTIMPVSSLFHLNEEYLDKELNQVLGSLLAATSTTKCSVILISDEETSADSHLLAKSLDRAEAPMGLSVLIVRQAGTRGNSSIHPMTTITSIARKLRRTSWCITIALRSQNMSFLNTFAEVSLDQRLFVWSTRLIVVTHIAVGLMKRLMSNHWIFSMMNTIFLNRDGTLHTSSWLIYTYMPYTHDGPEVQLLGSWTGTKGLSRSSDDYTYFTAKYSNFYGAIVNVTSLPWAPYWMEESYLKEDGTEGKIFYGSDGTMLHNIAAALNFTFYNIPCDTWTEVMEKLASRESLISPIRWTILPERLKIFDMTYVYDYSFVGFCMAIPPLKPQWQSLQYPLTNSVWLSIIASLITAPIFLYALTSVSGNGWSNEKYGPGKVTLEILGTFLGQNLSRSLPKTDSSRVMIVSWLIFAFIIGVAFRGNLTAHLTLPKFPPRIENVDELVEAADAINAAPYYSEFKEFFKSSKDPAYRKLGELMFLGMGVLEATQNALDNKRSAVIEIERYMRHIIADKFTKVDGSTELYIGRSGILPGRAAWGIPHDAPFTANIDWFIQASFEKGLYEKWTWDVLERSKRESMRRQREHLQMVAEGDSGSLQTLDVSQGNEETNKALSLGHMQGPLFLILIGFVLAFLCFVIEKICEYSSNHLKQRNL